MPRDIAKDLYREQPQPIGAPARNAAPVTIADADLPNYATALYVGVSGDLAVIPLQQQADTTVLFKNVPVGWFPVQVRRVALTGTSASQIIAVW